MGCVFGGPLQDGGKGVRDLGLRRRIAGGIWRAFAPLLALVLVLGPLAWVVERRALERQSRDVIAAAQSVWDGLATGDVIAVFGADAALPAAQRAEPMRNADCREESLGAVAEGVMGNAVLCLTEDGRGRRYFAVGLAWHDVAPVRDWVKRMLGVHFETFQERLDTPEQGILLYEEFWP